MWCIARVEEVVPQPPDDEFFGLVWCSSYRALKDHIEACGGAEGFRRQNGFVAPGDQLVVLRPDGSVKGFLA